MSTHRKQKKNTNGAAWSFLLLLIVMFAAFWPVWPYSVAWGYYPATGLGLLALLFFILLLTGAFIAIIDDETRKL